MQSFFYTHMPLLFLTFSVKSNPIYMKFFTDCKGFTTFEVRD